MPKVSRIVAVLVFIKFIRFQVNGALISKVIH